MPCKYFRSTDLYVKENVWIDADLLKTVYQSTTPIYMNTVFFYHNLVVQIIYSVT